MASIAFLASITSITPITAAKPSHPHPAPTATVAPPAPAAAAPAPTVVAQSSPPHVEYAACPSSLSLADLDATEMVVAFRRGCRNLRLPSGAAPTPIDDDDVLSLICVQGHTAVETRECGVRASVQVVTDAGTTATIPLSPAGEFAQLIRGSAIARLASTGSLDNATPLSLTVTTTTMNEGAHGDPATDLQSKSAHTALTWQRPWAGYGHNRYLWFPMPMLSSDFSSSAAGYRLGITPIAVALGTRWSPSPSAHGYLGVSLFVGWDLLVPNDTQTLSNTTFTRINYEAIGGGLLFDAAGVFGIGVGADHTFTTDKRTDLRGWLWIGPRLLSWFAG